MSNITYRRADYVDEYKSLTGFEYSLLPTEVKMAYLDSIYNYFVEEARRKDDKGNTTNCRGYVKPLYEPYFEENGCKVTNYDFGVEEFEVKCVDKNKKYEVSEEAREKLAYFLDLLGNAKADAFESCVKRAYAEMLSPMDTGDFVVFKEPNIYGISEELKRESLLRPESCLNDEEKKRIMASQLSLVLDSIIKGNVLDYVKSLPEEYKSVLSELVEAENLARDDEHQLKLV